MRIRAILPPAVAILTAGMALAAASHTLDGLAGVVRDAVERQASDPELARDLHRFELYEKMDDRAAEELESLAPGPKSIAELERLRERSRSGHEPKALPRFPSPPEPSPGELHIVLEAARAKALAYTAGLPNFICTETVNRFERNYKWRRPTGETTDTLTVQLTFFEHLERYKLTQVNGRDTKLTYGQLSGATSRGEFGSMLLAVFAPVSRTEFGWSNWTTLRKRPAYVFSFRIDAANSKYSLSVAGFGNAPAATIVGEHGRIYIDSETEEVIRMDAEADSIPKDFPVQSASRALDYGPAEVGGKIFLLPLHADVRMGTRDGLAATRNTVEFRDYRKFAGESSISFGDAVDAGK